MHAARSLLLLGTLAATAAAQQDSMSRVININNRELPDRVLGSEGGRPRRAPATRTRPVALRCRPFLRASPLTPRPLRAVDDFCLYAPPNGGGVAEHEAEEVAYCTKSGYGTRVFPEGTIQGAHWVRTPHYVQVTGTGGE